MNYPSNWNAGDVRYHQRGEIMCVYCEEYCCEDAIKKDEDGEAVCEVCAETITCYECGCIHSKVTMYMGELHCPECLRLAMLRDNQN